MQVGKMGCRRLQEQHTSTKHPKLRAGNSRWSEVEHAKLQKGCSQFEPEAFDVGFTDRTETKKFV
jgi:hypothetical protein